MFRPRTAPEAIDLVSRLLEYTPPNRLSPLQACAHAFFNELRQPDTVLPNGRPLPPLFNFTEMGKRKGDTRRVLLVFEVEVEIYKNHFAEDREESEKDETAPRTPSKTFTKSVSCSSAKRSSLLCVSHLSSILHTFP